MTIAVEVRANIQIPDLDRDALEKVFFGMGDVLTDLEDEVPEVLDHAVSIDLGRKLVTIEVTARGASVDEADSMAKAAVLLAMRATGGAAATAEQLRQFAVGGSSIVEELAARDVDLVSHQLELA
ncbi:hypothetical protein [Microbacterium maritypicum]|uniref:Uncharacterized protein n=1 Tax=Microbacterium maritypicum TaxID=33918 RepID=A0A4Y4BC91_MICMQ|nr:hypothetical protein [Microbacterium liquefaciens]GEC76437.1 hypothetical protein MLI01_25820 [Microbacterium liquefaciens]GGV61727.1 hypothetical protein GCM10010213_25750 [Microbacterium liquefaciens]